MDTSRIRNFAPAARKHVMEAVERKLDYVLTARTPDLVGPLSQQIASLRKQADTDRVGLIERVAYTWFNRLAALRFMDARGYHPFFARVLTPANARETQPELLKLVRTDSLPDELKPHADPARLNDLLDGRMPTAIAGADPQGEVYRNLVLAVCRYYHTILPFLFEQLDDETELLLPDDLLTATSVAEGFRTDISDYDCAEEEILGWFYQYYISDKKAEVMGRNAAVPKQDIPAVTQLFTPHWIVRYLVENSLGRLWLLNRPQSKLRERMPYYIDGEAETDFLKINKPEDIRLLDPACGSGHMLTYAFDLLYAIYEEEGYDAPEIPGLILRHNLYGADICDRAVALAAFALCMKARAKDSRFFRRVVQPHLISLQEIRFREGELSTYFKALGVQPSNFNTNLTKLLHQFEEAKNFGSLIQPCLDEKGIGSARSGIEAKDIGGQLFLRETHAKVLRVLEQAEYLCQRYHAVVANPPYMGLAAMNKVLRRFAEDNYEPSKANVFAQFIERSFFMTLKHGYCALVTLEAWMFLSSFEDLRKTLLSERTIVTMTHMDNMVMGIAFGTAATVWKNSFQPKFQAFYSHVEYADITAANVPREFPVQGPRCATVAASAFGRIAGSPIAYWISEKFRKAFDASVDFEQIATPRQGLGTTNNGKFLRGWSEVAFRNIRFGAADRSEARDSGCKWFPYNKGGNFRKWYGNQEFVVNWQNDGSDVKDYIKNKNPNVARSESHYFKTGMTWGLITSGEFSCRFLPQGFIFDVGGSSAFPSPEHRELCLGFLNSLLSSLLLRCINPTVNTQVGDLQRLPIKQALLADADDFALCVRELEAIACADWDNFETSWDFRDLPLLRSGLKGASLAASWQNWKAHCDAAMRRMQELETENNRLFIAAYGLQDELQSEVPEDQITLARADARKDMAAFLSYAVGCMFGRYSLDKPGLILADGGDSVKEYLEKVKLPLDKLAFSPDEDGIIPVLDGEWFSDDIAARFREFLVVTFGKETLEENVAFVETSLGKELRKYFAKEFYKNHISNERAYGYKKRPIYWMFSSPQGGFAALVYLHRYTRDTINTLLNRYLRDYLKKIEARLVHLDHLQVTADSNREKTAARKEADKLRKTLHECQEWEREVILPLAQQRIELDLDDGVKTNYVKFKGAVLNIPGLDNGEEE